MSELKRTQLYDCHLAAGATMVDFGGWEMPIQYPSKIVAEHLCTRTDCSIFDVSHMGRVRIEGPDAKAFLQKVLSSNVDALQLGWAQYCIIPNADGGAVDDAYLYRFAEDHYFLVVNASNTDKDLAHFAEVVKDFDCTVTNITADCASIAIQGPNSEALLKGFCGAEVLTEAKRNALNTLDFEGRRVNIARTGYTGEPLSYELFIESAEAAWLWNRLLELGAKPAGLGARDTLRLEAGLPLYGHELDEEHSPAEAGMGRMLTSTADYVGREGAQQICQVLLPLRIEGRRAARNGDVLALPDGTEVGRVTSGSFAPSLGHVIAFAWVDAVHADATAFMVRAARAELSAIRTELPFYADGTARRKLQP